MRKYIYTSTRAHQRPENGLKNILCSTTQGDITNRLGIKLPTKYTLENKRCRGLRPPHPWDKHPDSCQPPLSGLSFLGNFIYGTIMESCR